MKSSKAREYVVFSAKAETARKVTSCAEAEVAASVAAKIKIERISSPCSFDRFACWRFILWNIIGAAAGRVNRVTPLQKDAHGGTVVQGRGREAAARCRPGIPRRRHPRRHQGAA